MIAIFFAFTVLASCGSAEKERAAIEERERKRAQAGNLECTPEGPITGEVALRVATTRFDKSCIGAPASKKFTITLENADTGLSHNVQIKQSAFSRTVKWSGALVSGPGTITYEIPPLKAGLYAFQCAVHPAQMQGTLVVE